MTDASSTVSYSDPVQLNQGDTAHFITHYDDLSYQALRKISDGTRCNQSYAVLSEAVLLARGGMVSTASLLPLLQTYAHETIEPVWAVMRAATLNWSSSSRATNRANKTSAILPKCFAATEYERLGWAAAPNESEEDTNLRRIVIALSLYGENPDALKAPKTVR